MLKLTFELSVQEESLLTQVGIGILVIGLGLVLDQTIKTGWLAPLILFVSAVILLIRAIREKSYGLVITGAILAGCCAGLFWFLNSVIDIAIYQRIGLSIFSLGSGFLILDVGKILIRRQFAWWAFFVGWVIVSVSIPFLTIQIELLQFVFWITTGISSGFLVWGLSCRLIGLIIPGSILLTIGAGVFSAWSNVVTPNGLTETGIMLVWFALGWGGIIVFARVITPRFVWWPLIPGSILAVVGWGLYSGGNPNNALSFIGNTGSIAVLIFGLYLLLMRRGMKG